MKKLLQLVTTSSTKNAMSDNLPNIKTQSQFRALFSKWASDVWLFWTTTVHQISANTLGWIANITLHIATIPTLLGLMTGVVNKIPSLDVILIVWAALGLLFFRAVLLKDLLNIITISAGFMVQATLLALIFLK